MMKMMKKLFFLVAFMVLCTACNNKSGDTPTSRFDDVDADTASVTMRQVTVGPKTYNVADINDAMCVYRPQAVAEQCFFVISKKDFRLYVYEKADADTLLVAHFPICYARYPEAKTESGDMRTPECTMEEPFSISQIQPATDWCHDFGDGRGSIRSYGDWFLRLQTPGFTGVGIHGSTNNEASVPGRDSEGCIRLRDADLNVLHDKFARVGTTVVITGANQEEYSFQAKARTALADKYKKAVAGYQMPKASPANAQPALKNENTETLGPKPSEKEMSAMTRKPETKK